MYQRNNTTLCSVCLKCYQALSKNRIPKFSPSNNAWLGDIPAELNDLTIPEEKLISLYRHNSCIVKLYSPFRAVTTAQRALRGNCITFLQNIPNVASSLPLKPEDLSETLKVIFVGAYPPKRIELRKVLTVRKKRVVDALIWLKKYNILYQNINIDLENIAQLPEDDIPEAILLTMEQRIGSDEIPSERTGYVPDPLSESIFSASPEVIPLYKRLDLCL